MTIPTLNFPCASVPRDDRNSEGQGDDLSPVRTERGVRMDLVPEPATASDYEVMSALAEEMRYWIPRMSDGVWRETLLRLQARLALAAQAPHLSLVPAPPQSEQSDRLAHSAASD